MLPLPAAPDLLAAPELWRDWIRKLDNEQRTDARRRIVEWQAKERSIQLSALERIERMMLEEMVRRFPGLVSRVTHLEGALFLAQRDTCNTSRVIELLLAGGFVTQEKVNEAVSIIVASEAKLAKEVA